MKKIHLIILIIILLVGGYLILKPKQLTPENFEPEVLINNYIDSEDDNYSVEVNLQKTGYDLLDQEIQKEVLEQANKIKYQGQELRKLGSSAMAEMIAQGNVYFFSNDIRSYRLSLYQFTGGAHGNTQYLTWTYSTTGDSYKIKDLFKEETRPLSKLHPIVVEKLKDNMENPDESWIAKGTGVEDWENYSLFNIDNENLYILFPPYQVAPYSEGVQEVQISLEELSHILKDEFIK